MAVLSYTAPNFGHGVLSFSSFKVVCKKVSFGGSSSLRLKSELKRPVINDDDDHQENFQTVPKKLHKDLCSLPGQLTSYEFSKNEKNKSNVKIAFKGLHGSYSEEAAFKVHHKSHTVPCDQFEDTFKAVELWLADKAVLPIENSMGGSIHRNYDLLLRHRLHIVGEVQLTVNLCLLALPEIGRHQLTRVLSHPQALALCETFLDKLGVVQESAIDTCGAAQFIAENGLMDVGVIASTRAAEIYGLNVIEEYIQDDLDNLSRFLVLARDPIIPGVDKPFKTSIVFTLAEGPGALFKALGVFAMRDINLIKIESRPQGNRPLRVVDDCNTGKAKCFDYLFYVDFEASLAELRAQNALEQLQEIATFLRVLGCYAMDTKLE